MKTSSVLLFLVFRLLSATGGAAAGTNSIPLVAGAPEIDGVLDEAVWESAWIAELPCEVHPGENTPAPVRTEVRVMHDQGHLYVGFRAWDPEPAAIRANYSDRDDAWDDDWLGVVLDTFNDERRDYLLLVNPLGVQMDLIEEWSDGGGGAWDGIWDSSARITDWGWTAEMRIPFSTLRFQRSEQAQVWGFDAIRGYPRDRMRQMGAFPRDRDDNCYLCQAIKIEGFSGVSPGHNLDILPTVTTSRTERRSDFPDGGYDEKESDLDAGLTARWGFTPNLTLSATVNPDFSQVEADALQLDVNQPFALFFPEKRPFFMEGADFFSTQILATYTRMIRDPLWGAKITGKEGAHTIGAYVVEDDMTNLIFPGPQGSSGAVLEQGNTATVLRYKRDAGNRFTVGTLLTDRQGKGYRNSLGGADVNLRFGAGDRVLLQVLSSRTEYPGEISSAFGQPTGLFHGTAANLLYMRHSRGLGWWLQANSFDPGFRTDLGFEPQVDVRGGEVGLDQNWIGTDQTWYSNLNLKAKFEHREQHDGSLLFAEHVVQFTAQGPMQSRLVIRVADAQEGYAGRKWDADGLVIVSGMQPTGRSELTLTMRWNDDVDYDNRRQGASWQVNPGFRYQLGRHMRLSGRHIHERMQVDLGRLYTADVSELSASWQFNARSFLRAILQRVDYSFNTALYSDGRDAEDLYMFSQLLYSYKLNPQTVLFLGYSDNAYGDENFALTRADRTVFAKLGYAWLP